MALSFTEKQHWKNRIEKIVENKISHLKDLAANVISEIKVEAKASVEEELNVSEHLAEYKKRTDEIAHLEGKQRELIAVLAMEVFEGELPYRVDLGDIERQIKGIVNERSNAEFSRHELGKHMTFLQNEKSRLLDEVLLASNSQQITHLLDLADALESLPAPQMADTDHLSTLESPALLLTDYSLQ